ASAGAPAGACHIQGSGKRSQIVTWTDSVAATSARARPVPVIDAERTSAKDWKGRPRMEGGARGIAGVEARGCDSRTYAMGPYPSTVFELREAPKLRALRPG